MTMVYCRGCAKEIHETAPSCPQCGCLQQVTIATPNAASQSHTNVNPPVSASSVSSLSAAFVKADINKKFHLGLIIAATIAVILLYTTAAIPLIGIATGVSFGLSVRLLLAHKKNDFIGTKKLDWQLLVAAASVAFLLMLMKLYDIQGPVLIFVAVRSLVIYIKMGKATATTPPIK
ncbi:hypothetical protein AAKU64_004227 [Undibacterium sp. GrIS 1.8]|uniref:hypothetical protein n=1 Tax=Undibacterium sp. GrIS 1.8 TaxID=3143934 RepID=UPI00339A8750